MIDDATLMQCTGSIAHSLHSNTINLAILLFIPNLVIVSILHSVLQFTCSYICFGVLIFSVVLTISSCPDPVPTAIPTFAVVFSSAFASGISWNHKGSTVLPVLCVQVIVSIGLGADIVVSISLLQLLAYSSISLAVFWTLAFVRQSASTA
jgi:hypothetical protein